MNCGYLQLTSFIKFPWFSMAPPGFSNSRPRHSNRSCNPWWFKADETFQRCKRFSSLRIVPSELHGTSTSIRSKPSGKTLGKTQPSWVVLSSHIPRVKHSELLPNHPTRAVKSQQNLKLHKTWSKISTPNSQINRQNRETSHQISSHIITYHQISSNHIKSSEISPKTQPEPPNWSPWVPYTFAIWPCFWPVPHVPTAGHWPPGRKRTPPAGRPATGRSCSLGRCTNPGPCGPDGRLRHRPGASKGPPAPPLLLCFWRFFVIEIWKIPRNSLTCFGSISTCFIMSCVWHGTWRFPIAMVKYHWKLTKPWQVSSSSSLKSHVLRFWDIQLIIQCLASQGWHWHSMTCRWI